MDPHGPCYYRNFMEVEQVKYIIWAADMDRCVNFYTCLFGGSVTRKNEHIAEIKIGHSLIGIHSGGEGKKTWTGISFQVPDVVQGASELVSAGGKLSREPEPEDGEPPHLAMCEDTEGNQIMLTRNRG